MSSSFFTQINILPLEPEEKTRLRQYFTHHDETKVNQILFSIYDRKEKVEYLKTFLSSAFLLYQQCFEFLTLHYLLIPTGREGEKRRDPKA
ncbi:20890_t:CDS:2, partial [Cetraspora pellucida]